MPNEAPVRVARELASRGYNAEREAVTVLARADDIEAAIEGAIEAAPEDALKIAVDHARDALADASATSAARRGEKIPSGDASTDTSPTEDPSVSTGTDAAQSVESAGRSPVETGGSSSGGSERPSRPTSSRADRSPDEPAVENDVTGRSTGTGAYDDFVSVFRDRYERLGSKLRSRVNHRPAEAIRKLPGGSDVAMVGMVNDVRSTASGHWLVELEDPSGVFPWLVMKDRGFSDVVGELLLDEVLAMEGTLADDSGIAFVDDVHFPDVPRTFEPSTADRSVSAALISDVHIGSVDFVEAAWDRFVDWLHRPAADEVEYLLIAGDMVEGIGVYPGQQEELTIEDVYDQYEAFSELLKDVPGDVEIVMIPGNHDAVRLAEPQPGFDEELRSIMSAHDATITGNPSVVTLEGIDVLMYHGVSLDELIAEFPESSASYEHPHEAMYHLLKKRHLAPEYGGRMRIAPEERDYLVIDEVPDVLHAGHVHKLGVGNYHGVRVINSGAWQSQTEFQQSVNLQPDYGVAPILDLQTLEVDVRTFA
ncbi:MAG: DNA-directed DNA polymerase II small subunit [Halobacteriales archaeon]